MSAAWSNNNVYLVISLMNELLLYDYLCYHIKEVFCIIVEFGGAICLNHQIRN